MINLLLKINKSLILQEIDQGIDNAVVKLYKNGLFKVQAE
jgi:hypothetical protein